MEAISDLSSYVAGVPAMVGLILTALTMFLTSDWRLSLTALLVQYVFVGIVLTRSIQAEVVVVKILAGVLVVFILYLTARRIQGKEVPKPTTDGGSRFLGLSMTWKAGPLSLPLRLLAVVLVALALIRLFGSYRFAVASADVVFVALCMGGIGLLGLVLSEDPLRVGPAVLTVLAGFDLVYAGLEPGLSIVGFWSALTLLAALAFSYLATIRGLGTSQASSGEEGMEL